MGAICSPCEALGLVILRQEFVNGRFTGALQVGGLLNNGGWKALDAPVILLDGGLGDVVRRSWFRRSLIVVDGWWHVFVGFCVRTFFGRPLAVVRQRFMWLLCIQGELWHEDEVVVPV